MEDSVAAHGVVAVPSTSGNFGGTSYAAGDTFVCCFGDASGPGDPERAGRLDGAVLFGDHGLGADFSPTPGALHGTFCTGANDFEL